MDDKNYSIIFAKIFLYLNRFLWVTFGGVSINRIDTSHCFQSRNVNSFAFKVSKSKGWRRLGFVTLCFGFFSTFPTLMYTLKFFKQHSEEVISDTIYFVTSFIVRIGHLAGYLIFHLYGNRIFAFLSRHWLTKNQLRVCFSLLILTLTSAFSSHFFSSLALDCNEFHSNSDLLLHQTSNIWMNLPLALSTCLQATVSLLAYFALKDITRNLNHTENLRNCQKFCELKKRFKEMNAIFVVLNLSTLSFLICMILANLANLVKGRTMAAHCLDLFLNVTGLTLFCFVHGFPHNATIDLVDKFDELIAKKPNLSHSAQVNWILSRDTIGFKLFGSKCHESLLSPVS